MADNSNLTELQTLVSQSTSVLIFLPENPGKDVLAAGLALYLSFILTKKKTEIVCQTPAKVLESEIFGINKLKQSLSSKNFIISLDYAEGTIEKVSYNINDGKFNLVIETKPDAPEFTPEKVHYSSPGMVPNLIIVLSSPDLQALNSFYQNETDLISKTAIINLDNHQNNIRFGKINLIDDKASSISEMATFFLRNSGLPAGEDIATNLLLGIEAATHNFSDGTSAMAFEAAGLCLRAGGKRKTTDSVAVSTTETTMSESVSAPADWLQPKIFKSNQPPPTPSGESTTI